MELEERPHGTSIAMEEGPATELRQQRAMAGSRTQTETDSSYMYKLKHWWNHNISLVLDRNSHEFAGCDPRDHGALERTYLGWFRTSVAIVSFGIVVTQLFILQSLDPVKGKVFGAILASAGILTILLGCIRYFRQQTLLVQGKTLAGGWHVTVFLALLSLILLTLFVIVLVET